MSTFRKRFPVFFVAFVMTNPLFILAQGTNNPISKISIASPAAAALGKYGDIPVSYHTGIPQISIPIYTVTAGTLSLHVSLSYHASGLKVQEPASWVGAGWALNAGGVITRSVMGAPDEKGTNNAGIENHGHFSDYGYNSYMYTSNSPVYSGGGTGQDWGGIANGREDGEPDLFFFNFGKYNGKFYFRDDRTPVIVPEADFKIEPYYLESGSSSIQSFIITTPDGVKYYFGNTPGLTGTPPVEITKPVTSGNGLSTANVISSWYLNKVSTADDVFVITLTYVPETYGYHTISLFPIDGNANSSLSFGSWHGYDLIKNIVQGVHLSQISFPNGAVNFIEATAARTDLSDNTTTFLSDVVNQTTKPLGSIQVYDNTTATVLRKFNFTYNYFTDNTTPIPPDIASFAPGLVTDKQRLRLDQVQELSSDGTVSKPPYNFTYFSEMVPRRLSFSMDHWGFPNGVTNTTPIPTYVQYASGSTNNFPGADRDAYWPAMRAGTLQQINYPTGGYSLFEFEPNTVYNTNTANVNVNLANLTVHLYGQSSITSTVPFVTNGNAMNLSFNNSSNYSAAFSITNSGGTVVYNTNIGNGQVSATNPLTLPAGNYNSTLTCSSASNLSGGATAGITQYQMVITNNTLNIGGNRIKTITNNDGVTINNVVTSYSYLGDNNLSSGILYNRPAYVGIVRNDMLQNVGTFAVSVGFVPSASPNGCLSVIDATYFKSPGSIRPMANTQGNHIGYAQVKVAQSGNGYSIYKYYGTTGVPVWQANTGDIAIRTVNTQGCDANAPSFPYPPVGYDYLRGELQYEAQYNEAGQKLKEATYVPTFVNNPVKTPALLVTYVATTSGSGWTLATSYDLTTAKKTQTQVTETVYNPADGNALTTVNNSFAESPFHHEITRSNTTSSKGEMVETKNKFAFDFRISTCDNIADGYGQFTTDCNSCLATYNAARIQTVPVSCPGNIQCLTTAYLNYQKCLSTSRVNYVSYRNTNFGKTSPLNTFQSNHNAAKNAADTDLKPILELQDFYQDPPVETTKWRNGNLLGATFSRFDYSTSPTGKIYLNKVQAVNLQASAASFTAAATNASNNSLIKDSRYADETLIKFIDGNLAEFTAKDGVTTSYLWGYNKLLPIAKAIGVNQSTLSGAYSSAGGTTANLPALRTQPALTANSIQVNTYAYAPVIGMVTETDPNGKSISYEYDKLQRLLLIRDFNNNILKQYDYQYQAGVPNTVPQWQATGTTRCKPCTANPVYITNILQQQEKDNNPISPTYNTLRYTDIGTSSSCVSNADWQNTSTPLSCQKNGSNQNTGYQLQEQKDMNPCSPTGNTLRNITIYNTTACPLPVTSCSISNCSGAGNKCVNNVCEAGNQVFTTSVKNTKTGVWTCTYHYQWSDGSISGDTTYTSTSGCLQ